MNTIRLGSLAVALLLLLSSITVAAHATCASDANTLCLQGGQFAVTATWSSDTGPVAATASPFDGDEAGIFSFFGTSNPEVTVKVLDFRKLVGNYLVFTGGASDLGWQVTVRNTDTGETTVISNPPGSFSSGVALAPGASPPASSTAALASLGLSLPVSLASQSRTLVSLPATGHHSSGGRSFEADLRALFASSGDRLPLGANHTVKPLSSVLSLPASGACTADETTLCLQGGRFEITVERADGESWIPAPGEALSGDAAGVFHFFSQKNPEVTIKVLDFRPLLGRFLVFYDGTTNLGWRAHLTNTATGDEAEIDNPVGGFAAGAMIAPGPQQVAAMIGPAGGVLSFPDGSFKLTIPPGALADDTQISVAELTRDEFPTELQDPSVLKVYDLEPDGLKFAMPATVETHTAGSPAPPDGAPLIGLFSDSARTVEFLGPFTNSVDDTGIVASAPISHFSSMAVAESPGVTYSASVEPSSVPVDGNFTITAQIEKTAESSAAGFEGFFGSEGGEDKVSLGGFDPPGFQVDPSEVGTITRSATGTCKKVGVAAIIVFANIKVMDVGSLFFFSGANFEHEDASGEDGLNVFITCAGSTSPGAPLLSALSDVLVGAGQSAGETFTIGGTSPLTVTATSSDPTVLPDVNIKGWDKCTDPGSCTLTVKPIGDPGSTATVTVTVTDPAGQSASGTFKVTVTSGGGNTSGTSVGIHSFSPGAGSGPETVQFLGAGVGNISGFFPALFGSQDGSFILDLTNGNILRQSNLQPVGQFTGTAAVKPEKKSPADSTKAAGASAAAASGEYGAILVYGTSEGDTSIDNFDPTTGQWTNTPISGSAGTGGASLAGGTPDGGEIVFTQLDGLHFIDQKADGSFLPTAEVIPATSLGGNGGPVSAFEETANGPLLVASIAPLGASPPNGSLFFVPRNGSPPVEVGKVGVEPRRVRCDHGICGVTNNSDNSLTIVLWDGATMPTIAGTAPVGGGPVGLDLAILSNGDPVIGTTGYNDNTYTLTEVAADGSVVSNVTKPLDAGCLAPGHITFFGVVEGNDFVLRALVTCTLTNNYDVVPVDPAP